jgi:Ni/Fe-hydrogenase subunit HybB-like protein
LLTSGVMSMLFWAELVIGAIIPIVLFSYKSVRWSRLGTLIGALFVAAGIVLNRFNATWFAIKPLDGVSYWPSLLELGLLVGVASGVVLVFTLISTYFPVFSETVKTRNPEKVYNDNKNIEKPFLEQPHALGERP